MVFQRKGKSAGEEMEGAEELYSGVGGVIFFVVGGLVPASTFFLLKCSQDVDARHIREKLPWLVVRRV